MAKTLTKNFPLGSIEYRMPNVVESIRLLGQLGMTRTGTQMEAGQEYEFLAKLIDHMKPLVLAIAVEKAGVMIDTWDDALEHMELLAPLAEIANEIMSHVSASPQSEAKN